MTDIEMATCIEMTKRLRWYEQILKKKEIYPTPIKQCKMCSIHNWECHRCPLRSCNAAVRTKCIHAMAIRHFNGNRHEAVRRHYNFLIRKLKKAGYDYTNDY